MEPFFGQLGLAMALGLGAVGSVLGVAAAGTSQQHLTAV